MCFYEVRNDAKNHTTDVTPHLDAILKNCRQESSPFKLALANLYVFEVHGGYLIEIMVNQRMLMP